MSNQFLQLKNEIKAEVKAEMRKELAEEIFNLKQRICKLEGKTNEIAKIVVEEHDKKKNNMQLSISSPQQLQLVLQKQEEKIGIVVKQVNILQSQVQELSTSGEEILTDYHHKIAKKNNNKIGGTYLDYGN